MPIVHIKYAVHVMHEITGKPTETIKAKSEKVKDLISELGEKYSGFKEAFIDPKTGRLSPRNPIYLRRVGNRTMVVIDPDTMIQDGDILTFW